MPIECEFLLKKSFHNSEWIYVYRTSYICDILFDFIVYSRIDLLILSPQTMKLSDEIKSKKPTNSIIMYSYVCNSAKNRRI